MNKDSKKVQCSSEARGVCVCVCVCGTRACTHSYCTACIPAPEGTAAAVRLYFLSTSFFFSEGFPYPLSPQTPPPLPSLLICQPPTSLALFLSASTPCCLPQVNFHIAARTVPTDFSQKSSLFYPKPSSGFPLHSK